MGGLIPLTRALAAHRRHRGTGNPTEPLLRYRGGTPITTRRYDHLWRRIGSHLPWVATHNISTHWLRHTTITWVERHYGYGIARAYAGHTDRAGASTTTYLHAGLPELAAALAALTGEPTPWHQQPRINPDGAPARSCPPVTDRNPQPERRDPMSCPLAHEHRAHRRVGPRSAPDRGLDERAIPLVTLPTTVAHPAVERLPAPCLPTLPDDTPLVLGLSTVDHSGRIRDRLVLAALNWHPGDRTHAVVCGTALLIRRTSTGGVAIDTRGRVHLPAGARALLRIGNDDRIALLADPQHDLLIVHPTTAVTALLAGLHARAR